MMKRFLAAVLLGVTLTAAPGCAWLSTTDAVAAKASETLLDLASALRVLDLLAVGYIDKLEAPTPAELERAATIIDDLRAARQQLDLAIHDVKRGDVAEARGHARDALLMMINAADLLAQAGVDVDYAQQLLAQAHKALK